MISKQTFESKYSEKIKKIHEGKTYTSYLTFDPRNNFTWIPVDISIALKGGFEEIINKEGFKLTRKVKFSVQAGCHLSLAMPREQTKLDERKLKDAEMKWSRRGGQARYQIVGCTIYEGTNGLVAALIVTSPDAHKIRDELGLDYTVAYHPHITVGET